MNSKVDAASATISATKKEITVGETTTIKVVSNAAAWNIHVSGAATLSEADADSSCENVTKTFTVNFKGEKAGTYTFNLSGDVTDGNTDKTSKISGSTQVVVKEKVNSTNTSTPSNNTNNNNR